MTGLNELVDLVVAMTDVGTPVCLGLRKHHLGELSLVFNSNYALFQHLLAFIKRLTFKWKSYFDLAFNFITSV